MEKTDKEVLELCLSWFKDIIERSEKLTSGNVAHGRAAIRGVVKNYAEFVAEHLEGRWKPSDEQMEALKLSTYCPDKQISKALFELYQDLKKLREE